MKLHFLNTTAILIGSIICGSLQANASRVELIIPAFPGSAWINVSTVDVLPETFAQDMLNQEFTFAFFNEFVVSYQEYINNYENNQTDAPTLEKDITEEIQSYANAHECTIDSAILHIESYNPNFTTAALDNGGQIIFAAKNPLSQEQVENLINSITVTIEKNFEFMNLKATLEQKTDITSKNAVEKAEKAIIKKYEEVEKAQNNFSKMMGDYQIIGFQVIDAEKTA